MDEADELPQGMTTEQLGAHTRDRLLHFLETYTVGDATAAAGNETAAEDPDSQYYVHQIRALKAAEKTTLFVDFGHLEAGDWDLADIITREFLRVENSLRKVSC